MTREQYFEMCEALGSQPKEDEIPPDMGDFPEEVQLAFQLYTKLQDRWEGMSGTYMGKDLSYFDTIIDILGTEDKRTALDLVLMIDSVRQQFLFEKQKQKQKQQKEMK